MKNYFGEEYLEFNKDEKFWKCGNCGCKAFYITNTEQNVKWEILIMCVDCNQTTEFGS